MGCEIRTHGFSQSAGSDTVNDQELAVISGNGSIDGVAKFVEGLVHTQSAEVTALGAEPFAVGFGARSGVMDRRALYRGA